MKKLISLLLFVFTIASYSQDKTILQTDTNSPTSTENYRKSVTIGKWSTVSLSSGISIPSSSFSDNAYAKNGNYFELAGAYYFSKFGIGVSVGQISSPTNENFSSSTNSIDLSTTNTTQNWKQFYYGIGPEYKAQFGNFSATFSTKIGLQSVKSINLENNYTNGETPIAILKIKSDKNTSLSYFSTGLKFGYNLSSNFSLYAAANYMAAFSNGIIISKSKIADTNKNGIIDAEDLKFATGSATIDYETSTQNIKPQSTNFGVGISYSFGTKKNGVSGKTYEQRAPGDPLPGMDITIEQGNPSGKTKRKRPGRTTYSNITLERSPVYEGETQTGENPLYDGKNKAFKPAINPENNTLTKRKRPGRVKYSNITLKRSQAEGDGNSENDTARKGKRKARKECLKNGGSFWENGDGSFHCMMPLSTAKEDVNSSNELFRSKKRKCFKAGGQWVTNSHGSFCWNPKKQNANVEVRGWNPKENRTKGTNISVISEPASMGGSSARLVPITFSGTDNDCDDRSPLKRMNKGELVDAIAKDANLSKADAKRALETLTSNLSKSLVNGDSVQLVGFKQSISARAARTGRNPQTGATIKIAPYNPQRNGGKAQRNKAELVDAIAKDANLSKAGAGKALNTFIAILLKELNNGNCVKLIVPVAINREIREGGKTIGAGTNTKRKRPGRTKYSNITLKRSQAENDGNNGNNGTKAFNHNASRSNTTASKIDSKGDDGDNDDNGTRALNHNASRSNTTASKIDSKGDGNDENNGTKAFNHNASRSNTTASKIDSKGDGNDENNGTKAFNHNASRSNTTASKINSKGDDGDNDDNGTKAFNHNASRSNTTASKIDSKGDGNGKIQQGYTKESTMIFVRVDETSLRKSNTKISKDKSIQKNDKRMSKRTLRSRKRHGDKRYRERVKARTLRSTDKRYRERTKARTLRSADKRYRERTKARTLRSADKRYRERTKARTLRSADKRYRERTKARTLRSADKRYRERTKARTLRSADKRYRERTKARTLNTIQNDKPVQVTTKGNNKVKPSTNLDTRFFKVQNYQTIQIAKSKFQLTAPLIIGENKTELINYNWTVKNNKQNKEDKFTGKTINYNFDVSGTYQIEITPVVNNKKLSSYHLNIICN